MKNKITTDKSATHTPGPSWTVIAATRNREAYLDVRGAVECIGAISSHPMADSIGARRSVALVPVTHLGREQVDARLIAASPELLDAAEELIASLAWEEKRSGTTYSGADKLRAAIAKAEGK